ncbi:MAG: MBL fold metallo-hydrolase [Alphaproteobacteria bacterium]|nr:MBL fold metallo-hydrolase [Alphaproteobacteria bacterium]MCW5739022.1 MBL fold metallo-hydrolase [Alphaproteobacteria bacterium]
MPKTSFSRSLLALAGLAFAALGALPAEARCNKNLVERMPGVYRANFNVAQEKVVSAMRVTFVGHSSFLIETPQGVRAITDYNGYNGFGKRPDIVTMNNAHSTHFTDEVESGVTHVLRGWAQGQVEARHNVTMKDLQVFNVPTNVREWGDGGTRLSGNSIFVFRVGDLCVGHLGHLHHRLTPEHLEDLGRIDVLMVPIDGGYTMGQPYMADVVKQIQPRIVLPMHYWGPSALDRFLGYLGQGSYELVRPTSRTLDLVKANLPESLTVIVIAGHGGD